MKTLEIDIETFSSVNLSKSGVYRYVESQDFEILLFAYAVNSGEVKVVDLTLGEKVPEEIIQALTDSNIIKWAFNANFERVCLSKWLGLPTGKYLDPKSFRCTMIWSAYMGLPFSLEGVGTVLRLEKQKLKEGKDLIRYFCIPRKPTISNGKRTRNLPLHDLDKWSTFKEYNQRDVETEIEIQIKLSKFPVPENIWDEYHLDQEINDRGVLLDLTFINHAIEIDEYSRSKLLNEMKALTNLDNPNSVQQLKGWLAENGLQTDSLGKKIVSELLETSSGALSEVLILRQKLSKSSVKKYQTMENAICSDNRARGMFQFYGANRTGRFSGRILQPQNLPRNEMADLSEARELVRNNNLDALKILYDSIPEVLSELIRTSFIPKANHKFIVADFSSIERVVLAWLAGEKWVLDSYADKKDLYTATASQMFQVPIEEIDKKGPLRQKGKVADLACGYGGSVGALVAMGALDMGLTKDELKPLVNTWRQANSKIVSFWWDVDRAAIKSVRERTTTETHGIIFSYESGMFFIKLPSGRKLSYVKPRIELNQFGSNCISYEGIGATKKWERMQSYGPKFVENIVQAISRDILTYSMQNLKHFSIVMHIHDEIVIEAEKHISVDETCKMMGQIPPWAKGLKLRAEGFESYFYKKD
ncbi:MAG: DNA polymerase [Miniphocaeibacter sp.]|uniref:DNA polymerase n=1 Tax=Miniphocaeibacter sp. TaxID=3100973 RepID=UPI003BB0761B